MKPLNKLSGNVLPLNRLSLTLRLIMLVGVLVLLAGCGWPRSLTPPQVMEKLRPSTVMIRAKLPETPVSGEGIGSGTGIVWTKDGYIITNAHVVEGASALTVSPAGSERERPARLIGISSCDDLAVIKVDDVVGLEPAKFGHSKDLQPGDDVLALGYPLGDRLGIDPSITRGIISRLDAVIPGLPLQNLIQTDTTINHGNSGGPLVTLRGEVVGINTLGLNAIGAPGANFAISIDQAMSIIEELKAGNKLHWLGLNLVPNDPDYFDYFGGYQVGQVVSGLDSGGPASRIGIEPADLLLEMEGLTVNTQADVCQTLRSRNNGEHVKVKVLRRVAQNEWHILGGEIALGSDKDLADLELEQKLTSKATPTYEEPETQNTPTPTPTPSASVSPGSSRDHILISSQYLKVEVPTGWSNVAAAPWQNEEQPIGAKLAASTNLDTFLDNFAGPGLLVSITEKLKVSDPGRFLDQTQNNQAEATADCAKKQRFDYTDNSTYTGVYDLYTGCGAAADGVIFFMALTPKGSQHQNFIYLIARDLSAADTNHLLNTLEVGTLP